QSQHVTDQRPRERPCFAKEPDHTSYLSNDRPSRSSIDTTPVTACRRTSPVVVTTITSAEVCPETWMVGSQTSSSGRNSSGRTKITSLDPPTPRETRPLSHTRRPSQ